MLNIFTNIILGALIIESTCETIKMLFVEKQISPMQIGSLFFGIVFSIVYNLDLINLIGLESQTPYIGCIITGVLLSRGSGFAHDLLDAIFNIVKETESK